MIINKNQKINRSGWSNVLVKDIFSFVRTYAFSRDNLTTGIVADGKIGNIHYGDIHSTYHTPSINLNKTAIPLIKDTNFNPSKDDLLMDGDLIMADASEDYEGIGVTVSVHGIKEKKVVGGLHTFVLRDKKGLTEEYYRQYIFRNPAVRNKLQKVANGVSVYGISKAEVSKILLPIPPLPEQKRILTVLETWDRAIERLAKKIKIKKKIKKGLMQRLLTGKLRLSGFNEKWQLVKLGDICRLYQPKTITSEEIKKVGKYKVYGANGVIGFYDKYNHEDSEVLITCRGATCGRINFSEPKSWVTGNAMVATPLKNKIDKNYLHYLMQFSILKKVVTGLAQPQITRKDLAPFKISIPKLDEQIVIAKIITATNQEIEIYEQKLNSLKDQKKYLLNNLITGAIRTPETMSINA